MRINTCCFALFILSATQAHSGNSRLDELVWNSRHISFSSETLVPVTEADIWLSPCAPVSQIDIKHTLNAFDGGKSKLVRWSDFSALTVRVVISDQSRTLYIDSEGRVKVVGRYKVRYFEPRKGSSFLAMLPKVFDVCK